MTVSMRMVHCLHALCGNTTLPINVLNCNISKTHLNIVDMFKQISPVITHRQVIGAVETALLLTQTTHLMIPWRTYETQESGVALW